MGSDTLINGVHVKCVDYRGWPSSCVLTNGIVEAVAVPAIGRVMQFRFAGEERGVFWENRELDGMPGCPGGEWRNFGGDKAWPAPQEKWERVAGRAWPPPAGFDSVPMEAWMNEHGLTLGSPVDGNYGVQVLRQITLRPGLPVMDIASRYSKVSGSPIGMGVWIVTQLRDPEWVFALLPDSQDKDLGYRRLTGPAPLGVCRNGRLLSLRRDPASNLKIATQSNSLAWMDELYVLRIDGYSKQGTENACSAAVYTNMDPLQYVELETLGQVVRMAAGDSIELTNTYTLTRRSMSRPVEEACRAFGVVLE